MSTTTIPLFDRSGHPSIPTGPAKALRAGAVEEAACGTGEAGAKRHRRCRAQCYAHQTGTSLPQAPRRGYRPTKILDLWGSPPRYPGFPRTGRHGEPTAAPSLRAISGKPTFSRARVGQPWARSPQFLATLGARPGFPRTCLGGRLIRISGDFRTRVWVRSRPHNRCQLWSGQRRSPGDRAERADQAVVGGEPIAGHLAGIHDVGQLLNTELASQWLRR
jgi:hypothetical protein